MRAMLHWRCLCAVAMGWLVILTGCGKSGRRAEKPAARLELVSVAASAVSFDGMPFWNFVPRLKTVRVTQGDLPAGAEDMWVQVVFVSGSPAPEGVIALLNRAVAPAPPTQLITVMQASPLVDQKEFRYGVIDLGAEGGPPGERPDTEKPFTSAFLLAPQGLEDRWNLRKEPEIAFPIQGFVLGDMLTPGVRGARSVRGAGQTKGLAAVCLCVFRTDEAGKPVLGRLSEPITFVLDAAKQKSPESRPSVTPSVVGSTKSGREGAGPARLSSYRGL